MRLTTVHMMAWIAQQYTHCPVAPGLTVTGYLLGTLWVLTGYLLGTYWVLTGYLYCLHCLTGYLLGTYTAYTALLGTFGYLLGTYTALLGTFGYLLGTYTAYTALLGTYWVLTGYLHCLHCLRCLSGYLPGTYTASAAAPLGLLPSLFSNAAWSGSLYTFHAHPLSKSTLQLTQHMNHNSSECLLRS